MRTFFAGLEVLADAAALRFLGGMMKDNTDAESAAENVFVEGCRLV